MIQEIECNAFSSGQVLSKQWLLQEWEKLMPAQYPPQVVWILCGWYAVLSFMLFTRERIHLDHVRSFDLDADNLKKADLLNNSWEWQQWKFKAFTADICKLDWQRPKSYNSSTPDWIINSACEHLSPADWWTRVPDGQKVILQATDMEHEEHTNKFTSAQQMIEVFKPAEVYFSGEKKFEYETGFKFTRFMVIAKK